MDGISFATAIKYDSKLLCKVAVQATQVVFCRMAPLQKAQVSELGFLNTKDIEKKNLMKTIIAVS